MERYREYKYCPLSGINVIPWHWQMLRIKWLLSERTEKSKDGTGEPLSMSQKYGIVPTKQMDVIPNMASSYVGAKQVHKGDLVFNKLKAHLGVFAVSKYDGLVSPDYAVYIPTERTYLPYLEHLLRTQYYITEFQKKATGVAIGLTRLYTDGLFGIHAIYPPLAEQEKIVSYLEGKTSKIDAYVAEKEKEIQLLQELKQKTIADAVTKGLNPDVKMKDSGISWIGLIPEHWETKRVGTFLHERKEKYNGDDSLSILSLLKGKGVIPYEEKGNIGNKAKEDVSTYKVTRKGDVVVNCMNVIIGSSGITDYDGYISPAYYSFIPIVKETSIIYKHWLSLPQMQGAIRCMAKGILEIRLRVSSQQLLSMKIPIPPKDEQHAIVTYIEEKCQKIDTLVSELQAEIDNMKEYKQRLISDCVTGQVKV